WLRRKSIQPTDAGPSKSARRPRLLRSRGTTATRTRDPLGASRCKKTRRSNDSIVQRMDSATRARAAELDPYASWPRSFGWRLIAVFWTEAQIVDKQA